MKLHVRKQSNNSSTLVHPRLECSVQFRSLDLREDIDKIEKEQGRATKMIPEIKNHSYQSMAEGPGRSALNKEGCEDN